MFIGNDIVSLSTPIEHHRRFNERVFTQREMATIERSGNVHRWIAWAAKEAAYKFFKQKDSSTVFSPIKFEWHHEDSCILFAGTRVPMTYQLDEAYVHAWCAQADQFLDINVGVTNFVHGSESEAVRRLAGQMIFESKFFKDWCRSKDLVRPVISFETSTAKIPSAYASGEQIPVALSFSHDQEFVAAVVGWRK